MLDWELRGKQVCFSYIRFPISYHLSHLYGEADNNTFEEDNNRDNKVIYTHSKKALRLAGPVPGRYRKLMSKEELGAFTVK